jgi:hypothetical protein
MAVYSETFSYSDYANFVATSGWTNTDPLDDGTITVSTSDFKLSLDTGESSNISYTRTIDGEIAPDPDFIPGQSLALITFHFSAPVPFDGDSAGLVFTLALTNDAGNAGCSVEFIVNGNGADDYHFCNFSTFWTGGDSLVSDSFSFTGSNGYIYILIDETTGLATGQVYDVTGNVYTRTSDAPKPAGTHLTKAYYRLSGEGGPGDVPFDLSVNGLAFTYAPLTGGPGVTYYVPNLTGTDGPDSMTFFKAGGK